MNEESVREALHRRAVGYATDEIVEEYSVQDGEETLVRRRVTKKEVPPDISAAKLLLEEVRPLCELSDEALAAEKKRLLQLLKEKEEGRG